MSSEDLNGIESNNQSNAKGERLFKMLYIRLSHGKALTWEHIVEALESNTVGGNKLAEDIRNKYIKPQPASSEELVGGELSQKPAR